MEDDGEGSGGVAVLPADVDILDAAGDDSGSEVNQLDVPPPAEVKAGRRRFTIAAIVAIAITAVPFVWISWFLWGPMSPLRKTVYENNFYDLQTRAMLHGHLWLANGAIGIEAFVHGGHQYTYFGLFPSFLRLPILAVTSSLDGKLTNSFILASWLLTGLFASLLIWRVRILIRGQAIMGWTEAASFGVLIATIMGGTIWMYLVATPFVFNEDIAWSICLTVGSLFALLGVIERPSWGRVIASFALVLAANLDRSTTGWACVAAAVLIAGWFALGRGGTENRRWAIPVFGVGLVPLVVGCAVNYSKFGVLFGVSNFEQVWTHINAYRRKFLAANHNAEEGTIFVPTNLLAYLRPDGLRLTSVFPFITLPSGPPTALSGVLFDRRYRTASLPASSPFLFLLSIWGLVTAFRPQPIGKVARTRILLLAAGAAGAALLLWGYIAPRYLGDFVPFLVLASAVAMVDIWRRLDGRRRSIRMGALGVITVAGLFAIVANIGIAVTPSEYWSTTQVLNYVSAQKSVSDLTGVSLQSRVVRGSSLPPWGPADQLFVIGNCDGLYISNGEDYSTVPDEQFVRTTWMTVELGHNFQRLYRITFNSPASGGTESTSLVTAGQYSVAVSVTATSNPKVAIARFGLLGPGLTQWGPRIGIRSGSSHQAVVITDAAKHQVEVSMDGRTELVSTPANGEPIHGDVAAPGHRGGSSAISVVDQTDLTPQPTLCQSLIG